jgi:hypothetical protein
MDKLDQWRADVLGQSRSRKLKFTGIVNDMCHNAGSAFAGIGRHMANDFLHLLGIFPGTPAWVICSDDGKFLIFKAALISFMARWSSSEFLLKTAGNAISSNDNPFAFNETSNRNYMSSYLEVYKRVKAKVSGHVYNCLVRTGQLDPNHTIGMQAFDSGLMFH